MRRISLYLLVALTTCAAYGQYDQSIAVEGRYVPEYINHDRIGTFPSLVKFPLEESTLNYSLGATTADFLPMAVPIAATAWNATKKYASRRGYIDISAGSWLESNLSAGYRFYETQSSAAGVRLQHNSTSLWKPRLRPESDTRMWRYDESIGLYGHHIFDGQGRLEAAADYHIGNFNYYGFIPANEKSPLSEARITPPTQTLNDLAARVAWHSDVSPKFNWNAALGVRYFGYRRLYFPETVSYGALTGGRETDLRLDASMAYSFNTKSRLGLDVQADFLSYSKEKWRSEFISQALPVSNLDKYGMVSLTPHYSFMRRRLNLEIGARIDLAFNAGPTDDRYRTFHIAPAIRLDYDAGAIKIFLHALGGSELHTLASGWQLDYYAMPSLDTTTPVYTPLDTKIGVSFGPFSGFHAGADIAFRTVKSQFFGGYYQPYLNHLSIFPGLRHDLTGFSFGLNTGYDMGRYFSIEAEGRYQRQDGETGYFNGYDRPEWTASLTAETNPWNSLKFKIGYELRALRLMTSERLPNLSMLNFGASYGVTENISVRLQADNLLNRDVWYLPGLPEPGIRLSAGIGITF